MMIWVNGRLSTEDDARVSPFDHALLTGDGVFETLKVENGVPFAVRRHLERLARSAAGLALDAPPATAVRAALEEVVEANGVNDGVARITLTGGPAPLGSDRGSAGPTLIVACGPPRDWGPVAAIAIAPWPRNERGALAGLKTVSYAENVLALRWARERGAEEAFITSSTRDVQPISAVDGAPRPATPGPLTKAAMDAFADLQKRDFDP